MNAPTRLLIGTLLLILAACRSTPSETPLFTQLDAAETGLTFTNEIARFENDTLNSLSYDPLYNGGGVGIGDFDRDGRLDVFLSGNLVTSRLYLNRGNFRFEDITETAGVTTNVWCTGVSVADVNQDGWPDVYLCVAGPDETRRANLLFIHQGLKNGVPRFREMAQAYGLADPGFSTQAAFFDYDRDGDLDCYVLNNALERQGRNVIRPKRLDGSGPSTDRLYENCGWGSSDCGLTDAADSTNPQSELPHPQFRDVSRKAGILAEGYGLGLCVSDLNDDGWPDVYAANDFLSNDLLWVNQRNGTFRDEAARYFAHTSYNAMGVDIQDVNNDGLRDVYVVDMLPENNERQKLMLIKTNPEFLNLARQHGYQDEYVRNTLQVNRGVRSQEPGVRSEKSQYSRSSLLAPGFSEISQLVGISRTDWSWAPLLADFDLDGYRDLVVTNGYRRDIANLDYVVYLNDETGAGGLRSPEARKRMLDKLYELPETKIHNYAFRNRGDLTFEDRSLAWGFGELTYSNGAATADFDGDGDLDLVFNNIDGPAGLYRNERISTRTKADTSQPTAHFLRLRLRAPAPNRDGFGAKLTLKIDDGQVLSQELFPVRGYLSSVEPVLHVGLGSRRVVAGEIRWPDGRYQRLPALTPDRLHEIGYRPNGERSIFIEKPVEPYVETLSGTALGLDYLHRETPFNDFLTTPLLPHQFSKNGPGVAVGDVDGDGLDDVFIGGDAGQLRALYRQRTDGRFVGQALGLNDSEDLGSLFFDADGDGDQDLYVVSGGSQHEGAHALYQDRLYLNDGRGTLVRAPAGTLPPIASSGGCVVAADFDRDGDLDLFRAGRVEPGQYPTVPRSYLLRNDSPRSEERGVRSEKSQHSHSSLLAPHFSDITPAALRTPGLVCAALWTDADNDGWVDLLLVGEWMAPTLFKNERGQLSRAANRSHSAISNSQSAGWWNSLTGADFDADGDTDYLLGNLGLNSRYRATPEQPVRLYANDFDGNGRIDPLMTYYLEGQEHFAPIRDVIVDQMPSIKKTFASYTAYARGTLADAFGADQLQSATRLTATEFRSGYLENRGGGTFVFRPLPLAAQVSPVFGMQVDDFDGDGNLDALLVGNSFATETYAGWYDAGQGTLLLGDGRGGFRVVPYPRAGLDVPGDAKALARIETARGPLFVVSNPGGPVQLLRPTRPAPGTARLLPESAAYALLTRADGRTGRVEFYRGSGYLSGSTRRWRVPAGARNVRVFAGDGREMGF
jgi:hypothetical protein